jgi:hypothetical protein
MSLFSSLFGKKKPFTIHNKVWMEEPMKDKKLMEHLASSAEKKILLISFFEETHKKMEEAVSGMPHIKCMKAGDITQHRRDTELKVWFSSMEKELLFAEHSPLLLEEEEALQLMADLSGQEMQAVFYISLDDPIIAAFSGTKVKSMMERMGMAPEEMIQHSMIDSSIQNAQKKLQEKVGMPMKANSLKEWFSVNVHP